MEHFKFTAATLGKFRDGGGPEVVDGAVQEQGVHDQDPSYLSPSESTCGGTGGDAAGRRGSQIFAPRAESRIVNVNSRQHCSSRKRIG